MIWMKSTLGKVCAAFGVVVAASWASASAAELNCSQIRIIEPYPPGGAVGVVSRIVSEYMTKDLGIPTIVDNRPGASGNIGSAMVAKAKPDGCTFLMGTDATHVGNYYLFRDFPYDPIADFTPITVAAKNLLVLVANPAFPADNLEDLITYAKAHPGEVSYGVPGIGSPHHIAGELFSLMSETKMMNVPYNGNGPALSDVIGNHIPLLYSSLAPAMPHIQAGSVKALGITEVDRFEGLPDVPSIGEVLPGYEMSSWLAFFAPAGLPDDVLKVLHRSITDALKRPKVEAQLKEMGLLLVANSPEDFAAQLKVDFEKRGELIRSSGIQPQ